MVRTVFILLLSFLPGLSLAVTTLEGDFIQGGLVRGQVSPKTYVYYGAQKLHVDNDGHFILGFGRDADPAHILYMISPSGQVDAEHLQISKRTYQVQRIDGISKQMMDPNPEEQTRISREATSVSHARMIDSPLSFFKKPFIWPLTGRISGVYGSQRILNGEPRHPHFGIDIAAPEGTKVKAPAGGVVTLAHEGMFYSGKTLILDHGHGLSSTFLHLRSIRVSQGEQVSQGQIIAEVGATGRVTGPHLDWRMNWFDQRLDPSLLVPEMPK